MSQALPMLVQVAAMKKLFPQFVFDPAGSFWLGTLTPRETAYQIKIVYMPGSPPRVYMIDPEVRGNPPFIHQKHKAMGLYYPPDGSWTPAHLIAETIVPWAAEWLYFYEIWQMTGRWFGQGVNPDGTPYEPGEDV